MIQGGKQVLSNMSFLTWMLSSGWAFRRDWHHPERTSAVCED